MNHVLERSLLRQEPAGAGSAELGDPLSNVAAVVELNLARAHEEGRAEQVRLLHAVLALLAVAPRH